MKGNNEYLIPIIPDVHYDRLTDLFITKKPAKELICRPLSVSIRVGEYCNLACPICLSDSGLNRTFSHRSFLDILQMIGVFSPLRLVWTGGEPLLYPIEADLYESVKLSLMNVITTNLTIPYKTKELIKSVVINVSIYGWDRESFLKATGKDCFLDFEHNLNTLFEAGHLISASLRIDDSWRESLPNTLSYIRRFPYIKLLLQNTLMIGRTLSKVNPLGQSDYQQLEKYIISSKLPFPTILPCFSTTPHLSYDGYILIQHSRKYPSRVIVNNTICNSRNEFLKQIEILTQANFTLFTLQKYIQPTADPIDI